MRARARHWRRRRRPPDNARRSNATAPHLCLCSSSHSMLENTSRSPFRPRWGFVFYHVVSPIPRYWKRQLRKKTIPNCNWFVQVSRLWKRQLTVNSGLLCIYRLTQCVSVVASGPGKSSFFPPNPKP